MYSWRLVALSLACANALRSRPASRTVPSTLQRLTNKFQNATAGLRNTNMTVGTATAAMKAMVKSVKGCEDLSTWKDSEGDSCSDYTKSHCKDAGDYEDEQGVTALSACCVCKGGMKEGELCTSPVARGWGVVNKKGHCDSETETRGLQKAKSGQLIFFGDSDLEYWENFSTSFPGAENCGVGGGTAFEAAFSAPMFARNTRPRVSWSSLPARMTSPSAVRLNVWTKSSMTSGQPLKHSLRARTTRRSFCSVASQSHPRSTSSLFTRSTTHF